MKAMIFAAGLGTRLRPLTNDRPKALVEIDGKPLLEWAIRRLKLFGYKEIIVNIHHFGDLILQFLEAKQNFNITIHISDERDLLLDTGGGLKKAEDLLKGEPFLVYNTDILSNIDLEKFREKHLEAKALATLAVRQRESSRYLLFDEDHQLSGWRHTRTGEQKISRAKNTLQDFAFSGIHMIDPRLFDFMPEEKVFSIIDVYLEAAKTQTILAFPHNESIWLDVGKIPALEKAADLLPLIEFAR